jgi:hypothetical protein
MKICVRIAFAKTIITLQRLHLYAFGSGTFAYPRDQSSSPHEGLLRTSRHYDLMTYRAKVVGMCICTRIHGYESDNGQECFSAGKDLEDFLYIR